MITLEQFKKIFKHIKDLEERNDKLTDLLVDKECCGWISHGTMLTDDILDLLTCIFKLDLDDDLFSWWLYDISEDKKFIYHNNIKYNLNSLDDLYYYAKNELDKVKQESMTEKEKLEPIYQQEMSPEEALEFVKQCWEFHNDK